MSVACRQRKAKCDGSTPCGSCTQAKLADCTYPSTAKKVDPDYLKQLEQRIEELSSAVARSQQQNSTAQFSVLPPLHEAPSEQARAVGTQAYSLFSNDLQSQTPSGGLSNGAEGGGVANTTASTPTLRVAVTNEADSKAVEGRTMLTLVASPGVNTHFPDSSTRTLFDEVEGATRRLVGASVPVPARRQTRGTTNCDIGPQGAEAEGMQIFSYSKSQQDLYTLPHRELSDALVKIYYERIHPSKLYFVVSVFSDADARMISQFFASYIGTFWFRGYTKSNH